MFMEFVAHIEILCCKTWKSKCKTVLYIYIYIYIYIHIYTLNDHFLRMHSNIGFFLCVGDHDLGEHVSFRFISGTSSIPMGLKKPMECRYHPDKEKAFPYFAACMNRVVLPICYKEKEGFLYCFQNSSGVWWRLWMCITDIRSRHYTTYITILLPVFFIGKSHDHA